MTPLRKLSLAAAGLIVTNDLLWLGCPIRVEALAHPGFIQAVSAFLWFVGCGATCVPYAFRRTKHTAWIITPVALGVACALTAAVEGQFTSPIFTSFGDAGRIVGGVYGTWALGGAISLAIVSWRWPTWAVVCYEPSREELLEFFSGLAPDEAVVAASPSAALYD